MCSWSRLAWSVLFLYFFLGMRSPFTPTATHYCNKTAKSLTEREIINELVAAGGKKPSETSVCFLQNTGCFYFDIFKNYFTVRYCIVPTDHPSLGIQVFNHYLIEKIVSLHELFSNFDRTVSLVCNF